MFLATMWPSLGETAVFMQHLVLVILCGRLSGMQSASCIPDSRPKHVEIDKYTRNKLCSKLVLVHKIIQRCTVNKTSNSSSEF